MRKQNRRVCFLIVGLAFLLTACAARDKTDSTFCCGENGYWVHVHEEICYYGNGNLRCPLPQVTEHIHGVSCYGLEEIKSGSVRLQKQILVCEQTQLPRHTHSPECFSEPMQHKKRSPFVLAGFLHAVAAGWLLYMDSRISSKETCLPQL